MFAVHSAIGLHVSLGGVTLAVKVRSACAQLNVDSTGLSVPAALAACNEELGLKSSGTLIAQADELVAQLGLSFDDEQPTPSPPQQQPRRKTDPLMPSMVVFDLDFTLWHPELYQLSSGPPFSVAADGCVLTARGERLDLFPAARAALCELADAGVPIAIASRASDREWAMEIMRLLRIDERRTVSDAIGASPVVIQAGSKTRHLKHIAAESGVPLKEMLFFDNERTNIQEVQKLGVTCAYCPRGLKDGVFREGITAHVGGGSSARRRGGKGEAEEQEELSGRRARQAAARARSNDNKGGGRRGGRRGR